MSNLTTPQFINASSKIIETGSPRNLFCNSHNNETMLQNNETTPPVDSAHCTSNSANESHASSIDPHIIITSTVSIQSRKVASLPDFEVLDNEQREMISGSECSEEDHMIYTLGLSCEDDDEIDNNDAYPTLTSTEFDNITNTTATGIGDNIESESVEQETETVPITREVLFTKAKVNDLQKYLKEHNLSQVGLKSVLMTRVKENSGPISRTFSVACTGVAVPISDNPPILGNNISTVPSIIWVTESGKKQSLVDERDVSEGFVSPTNAGGRKVQDREAFLVGKDILHLPRF